MILSIKVNYTQFTFCKATMVKGIGRQLTNVLVERLLQVGIDSMLLWVFADNPARRFYEALGGKMIKESQFEIAGVTICEVAYGWLDIRMILKEQ